MQENLSQKPIYDSAKLINPFFEEIKGLKENSFILRRMIYTNFKTRYKRSYLGVIWSMLNPLLNMIVFVIIFSNLFRFDVPHYSLYILSGNMIFTFFSQSTSEAMMQIIANAGMYSPNKNQTSRGYLKNKDHINNSRVLPHYNAVIALHPKDTTLTPARIFDLTCTSFPKLKTQYQSFVQGMRMIDCEGIPLAWDKNPDQLCSMILASNDSVGNFYFFFTRAPFAHRQMISFLLGFQLNLRETIYLEGGPESSLYIKSTNQTIERHGTYVSKTWEKTDNSEFWKLPNVIAIKPKHQK